MTDWEAQYQNNDCPWDKGAPSPGLVDFLAAEPDLPRGTVCVPGCGRGHDVGEWARHGFDVTGYDLAPTAMREAQAQADAAGYQATFQTGNFLQDRPETRFDWVFEHTLFCAIQPEERDAYVESVAAWLKPSGQFLAIYYLLEDEDGPPFPSTREEIHRRFGGRFEVVREWVPRSWPNRTDLEWMVWWRPRS